MSVIEVKDVSKKFGNFTALNNVKLTVNKGDILGFIGPNGAGKSTTIRIMLGMLKANSGSVTIFGQDAWSDAVNIHERISYVPGDAKLWPNLTGGQVIDIFLKMRNQPINQERRDYFINYFDLDPNKKCRTYSKGNRQKVVLVAALAADADLYILDEPTSGLDPLMERKFQQCILEAKQAGKSVLLSSHILSEVEELCDSIVIIRDGEIIESGNLESMRHLTRQQITVETKQPIPELSKQAGVHELEQNKLHASFQVDSQNLNEVMAYLANFSITKLNSNPPTLEDLFLSHYEDDQSGKAKVGVRNE